MKIKSISIENFRSIKNATINFNEITALVEKIMLGKQPFLELWIVCLIMNMKMNFFLIQCTDIGKKP